MRPTIPPHLRGDSIDTQPSKVIESIGRFAAAGSSVTVTRLVWPLKATQSGGPELTTASSMSADSSPTDARTEPSSTESLENFHSAITESAVASRSVSPTKRQARQIGSINVIVPLGHLTYFVLRTHIVAVTHRVTKYCAQKCVSHGVDKELGVFLSTPCRLRACLKDRIHPPAMREGRTRERPGRADAPSPALTGRLSPRGE